MGSSVKINSISIDLAGAANETDMVKCDHFSIRGFVAETRERDFNKCWPFSKESAILGQRTFLPPLDVQKFRWWRCMSCIRDIDADGTKDCGLYSNSRCITSRKEHGSSSVNPSQRKMNSLTVIEEEKERNSNIADNAVVRNEDVNCETSQKKDQRATTSLNKCRPPSMDASTVRSKSRKLARPEQVVNKRSKVIKSPTDISRGKEKQNVDELAVTTFASSEIAGVVEDTSPKTIKTRKNSRVLTESEKVSSEIAGVVEDTPPMTIKTRKSSRVLTESEKVSSEIAGVVEDTPPKTIMTRKSSRVLTESEKVSSEIAGVVEDTPPKTIKSRRSSRVLRQSEKVSSGSSNLAISGWQHKKARRVRQITDLLGVPETEVSGGGKNTKKEESSSKKAPARGRKRKLVPENNNARRKSSTAGATSKKASKSLDSDQGDSDSGYERDPIKGKQKNRRFQVVDEFVQEGVRENDEDPSKNALPTPEPSLLKEKDPVPSPPTAKRTQKKTISLARKKKSVIGNRKSSLRSFGSGMEEGNQVKPQTGPSINESSEPTPDSLNEQRVDSLLDDQLASEGYIRKAIPQVNDRPDLSLQKPDNDHMTSKDAEANCVPEIGSSSKFNTVGWLSTGVDAVDFSSNNNFNLSSISSSTEVADRSSLPQKDESDRKGKKIMVQEHHGALGSQSHDKKENTPEELNDDIPMEIAEILAKTLHETSPSDKEEDVSNKQPPQETPHKSKNALLIDLNETYDHGTSLEDNNISGPPKPCDTNAARKEDHFLIGKQKKSLELFPISQPYKPSPFGIFPPTQENRASSIRFSGQSCQWNGNVPPMANQHPSPSSYGVLRPYNTCHSILDQYRERPSRPIWTSSMIPPQCHPNPAPFNMDQSTRFRMLSQAPSNDNTWNLSFLGANGNQKCGPNSEFSFGYRHGTAGVNSIRSMDAFSSDSSTALKLLNLMDPQLRSNTPADHHGNTNFTRRHFPPVNQSEERIEFQTGDSSKTPYPTMQLPFDLYRNGFAPESSRKSFPIVPPFGTSSLSFQNAQAPWSHHQAKTANTTDAMPPFYSSHETPVFPSSNEQGRFQLLGASNSMKLPLKTNMTDKEMEQKGKAESCSKVSALPPRNSSGSIECSVNRNPADFTIPEPGNVYMLTGENLKGRKRAPYKKKASLCQQDALKQTKKPAGPSTENA